MQSHTILLFVTTLWSGLVLGISFVAQPAKFGAAGLQRDTALSVGRRIFRAMHAVEAVFGAAALMLLAGAPAPVLRLVAAAVAILALQATVLMPRLSRRVDQVLAGQVLPKSADHMVFAVLELIKFGALAACAFYLP